MGAVEGHLMIALAIAGGLRPAKSQPARRRPGHADDGEPEIEEGHVARIAEVVVIDAREGDIGSGHAEDRAEERERTGGGRRQPAADPGIKPSDRLEPSRGSGLALHHAQSP
jgi:hypothetical protein